MLTGNKIEKHCSYLITLVMTESPRGHCGVVVRYSPLHHRSAVQTPDPMWEKLVVAYTWSAVNSTEP